MTNREIAEKLESIETKLASLNKASEMPFDLIGAADYLKMSKSHLYSLTCHGEISFYKPAGKRLYFEKSDLDEYIKRNRVKARFELENEAANRQSA